MSRGLRSWSIIGCVMAMVLAIGTSGAQADGSCGRHDSSGPSACPIHSAGTYHGSLTPRYDPYPFYDEHDYYVFHAKSDTALDVTVHDDETPTCGSATLPYFQICGDAGATLYSGNGTQIAYTHTFATFENAIPVRGILDYTIHHAGTYYLVISGALARVISGTYAGDPEVTLPYSFHLAATPDVFWPAHCTVPRVGHRESLASAKRSLTNDGCRVGRIHRAVSHRTRPGDLLGFDPGSGRVFSHGTRIGVIVARR